MSFFNHAPILTAANIQSAAIKQTKQATKEANINNNSNSLVGNQLNSMHLLSKLPPANTSSFSSQHDNYVFTSSHTNYYGHLNPNVHHHAVSNVRYENTYSLGPSDSQKINFSKVEKLVSEILASRLEKIKYEPTICRELTKLLCEEIKMRVKAIIYKRYKIVVSLNICQNVNMNLLITSRALWDTTTDNCCTVNFKNRSLHAIATVFAVYYD